MALIHKALFIATGGLSGWFFKEDPKEESKAKAAPARARAAKPANAARPKARATQQAKPKVTATAKSATKTKTTAKAKAKRARAKATAKASTARELKGLVKLHEQGALSAEEFAAAKAKVIGTGIAANGSSPSPQPSDQPQAPPIFPAVEANILAARGIASLAEEQGEEPRPSLGIGSLQSPASVE